MAYVAMNDFLESNKLCKFLNGVCRHELMFDDVIEGFEFLNGVCRHERMERYSGANASFLNGVCRHEQFSDF